MKNCYKTAEPDRYSLLKDNAKQMRNRPTDTERLIWQYLRASQLGAKFRRQHPIGDYIADFVCLSKQLIVEIDGSCHLTDDHIEHDRLRDERLKDLGYTTIRFTNEQVNTNLDGVLQIIKKYIQT